MNTIYNREAVERCKTPKSLGQLNYTARNRAETSMERTKTAVVKYCDVDSAKRNAAAASEHHSIAKAALIRIRSLAKEHGGKAWEDAVYYATAHTAAAEQFADNAHRVADEAAARHESLADSLPATTGGAACGH